LMNQFWPEFTDRTQTGVKCKCVNIDLGRHLSVSDIVTT
jgi:hypothetical protein